MLSDLKQPARLWWADAIENCGNLLESGEDPSFAVEFPGVKMEVRLVRAEGVFTRKTIRIPNPKKGGAEA